MEATPPSYAEATLNDHWNIIARYVPSNDLCSAALVSSRWHATFAPHLWGNPASHFGIENDAVYVALTKFKRTLQTARLLVRSLTHTLHLPPAHAELYNGPHADWLRGILERLPNLQALIVRGLPFFDHSALQALRYAAPKRREADVPDGVIELPGSSGYSFEGAARRSSTFGLRLLDASRCSNVTASGLVQALSRFESLMYLDLSFTYSARDPIVLATFRRLSGLQVLKLRGLSLTDEAMESLAPAIGLRIRSLDVRDNRITDRGVRTLLDHCFASRNAVPSGRRSPALLPYLGAEMLDIYQGEEFEGFLRSTFTRNFVSRLAIEDVPEGGITHLYVSGNRLTAEGASGLVRSGRLHVLDLASVESGLMRHPSLSDRNNDETGLTMPGVEKLTPVIWHKASEALTFLRIEHDLVTKDAPHAHADEIVQGRVELGDTALPDLPLYAAELPAVSTRPEAVELPTTVQTPRYELPGDPMQFVVSPAINDPPHEDEEPYGARRGSALAPEVVDSLHEQLNGVSLLSPVSAMDTSTMNGTHTLSAFGPVSPATPPMSPLAAGSLAQRPRSYSSVATERKARLNAHTSDKHNLHPAMVPHVSTLVLTDVPPQTSSRELSDRLISYIKQCAEESALAKAQAKLDYALPPGRKGQASILRHSATKVFALRRIVLELAPQTQINKSSKASPWQHTETKSMTDDRDTEALWSAAETDYSFFGDGDECEFPSLERDRVVDSASSSDKELNLTHGPNGRPKAAPTSQPEPVVDTVAALSAFRKERKLAHERAIAAHADDLDTEGYWDGLVQVVRPANGIRPDEELDYYGNTYVGGYLYR